MTVAPQPAPPVPLTQLREGERGWLQSTNLCCEDCDLLNAMGMTDRCEIRVCQKIGQRSRSSNGACIVQVNSTRLGLSAALASKIFVSVSPDGGIAEASA